MGESGAGKTYSLKNFESEEVSIFSVEKSRLPFQKKLPLMAHAKYQDIMNVLAKPNKGAYVIDDSQYLLVNEMFDGMNAGVNNFDMYKKLADTTIALCDGLKSTGIVNIQYIVKDNRIYVIEVNPRASRTVPYMSKVTGIPMVQTQTDGISTCKSPEGMFEGNTIPNDLKFVHESIKKYYGLKPFNKQQEN